MVQPCDGSAIVGSRPVDHLVSCLADRARRRCATSSSRFGDHEIAPNRRLHNKRPRTADVDRARTIVDLAQLLDGDALRRVIYDVVARRLVTAEQVLSAAQDFGGRAGLALLGRVLDEFDDAFDSALEAEADQRFREAGLVFDRQVEVWDHGFLVARLDFADEQRRLGIEIDGARYHSGPEARRRDRLRDRELHRLGWQIVRFGADDVRRAWRDMVQRLHMLTNDSRDAERWTA